MTRVRVGMTVAIVAAVVLSMFGGATVVGAQEATEAPSEAEAPQPSVADNSLVGRLAGLLVRIDEEIAGEPILARVNESGFNTSSDITANVAFWNEQEPDLTRLFVDADEAAGQDADAVADAARGLLLDIEAWRLIGRYFDFDVQIRSGGNQFAEPPDALLEAIGQMVFKSAPRLEAAYGHLRNSAASTPQQKDAFENAYQAARLSRAEYTPIWLLFLSLPTSQQVHVVDRFATDGVDAPRHTAEIVCVERGSTLEELEADPSLHVTALDCPALQGGLTSVVEK